MFLLIFNFRIYQDCFGVRLLSFENWFDIVSCTNCISPIQSCHFFRLFFGNSWTFNEFLLLLRLNQFYSNSCFGRKNIVYLSVDSKTDVDPTSTVSFCWPVYYDSLSILTDILFLKMMISLDRVHDPSIPKVWMQLK